MSLGDIKSQHVVSALREFDSVGRTAFLAKYGFGKSREYMLRDPATGNLYDSKAIVGAAYGYAFPENRPLRAENFSGGEATVERKLVDLGFEVVRVGQDWSPDEVALTVADYFEMLQKESKGYGYSKSEHNEHLRRRLKTRSKASIELKHQNISAVLDQLGLPYIQGYKPRTNLQELLRNTVIEYVKKRSNSLIKVVDGFEEQTDAGNKRYLGALVDAPQVEKLTAPRKPPRLPRKLDFAARDESNRKLGCSGESWVVGFEECRVIQENRPDLVAKIDWISKRLGDGAGYDILSFESNDTERYIEVKTTNGGSLTPFVVSRNELEFSEEVGERFCLYRLFDFSHAPKIFILRGSLSESLALEAMDYRARLKSVTL